MKQLQWWHVRLSAIIQKYDNEQNALYVFSYIKLYDVIIKFTKIFFEIFIDSVIQSKKNDPERLVVK